jgi:hypothetical protein
MIDAFVEALIDVDALVLLKRYEQHYQYYHFYRSLLIMVAVLVLLPLQQLLHGVVLVEHQRSVII